MSEKTILVTKAAMPPYEEYIEAIKPLWDTHWITNMGKYHEELENKLQLYLNVPKISLTVNGHMALEMVIQAFDFPQNSEVITTPFTFISTTHAIVRNHLKPVFCDINPQDGTIDETKIEGLITEKTVAIVPVHVYGNVCNIEAIQKIAEKYGLKVIYDAAHAFAVNYKGKGIGNYGDAAIFSFHATKVFNTIEGGAVAFSDHSLYEKLYNLKNFGIRSEELVDDIGANAKMNEFAAIMGLCNLNHIEDELFMRKQVYDRYVKALYNIDGIRIIEGCRADNKNYSYFPIEIEADYPISRDELYNKLKEKNIYTRKYFYPITADQKCYIEKYNNVGVEEARKLARNVLVLPIYASLDEKEQDGIINQILLYSNS